MRTQSSLFWRPIKYLCKGTQQPPALSSHNRWTADGPPWRLLPSYLDHNLRSWSWCASPANPSLTVKSDLFLASRRREGKRAHLDLDKAENPSEPQSHGRLSPAEGSGAYISAPEKRGHGSRWAGNIAPLHPSLLQGLVMPATHFFNID